MLHPCSDGTRLPTRTKRGAGYAASANPNPPNPSRFWSGCSASSLSPCGLGGGMSESRGGRNRLDRSVRPSGIAAFLRVTSPHGPLAHARYRSEPGPGNGREDHPVTTPANASVSRGPNSGSTDSAIRASNDVVTVRSFAEGEIRKVRYFRSNESQHASQQDRVLTRPRTCHLHAGSR